MRFAIRERESSNTKLVPSRLLSRAGFLPSSCACVAMQFNRGRKEPHQKVGRRAVGRMSQQEFVAEVAWCACTSLDDFVPSVGQGAEGLLTLFTGIATLLF
eukprot:TRINITY_DN5069_c0_g1_i1.p1 TRINITY_DN5069_c0_g1~~TRINITY_DN5069_c0_g1_i1.p1  ORF type:complete len:101 (-),score=5.15 TRINITY_DN5069_c0_g1_i1:83-385(-)